MKRITAALLAALSLGIVATMVYAGAGQGVQIGADENPLVIQRLLMKFDQAQASAPLRYPTACVAGTAETYTRLALSEAFPGAAGGPLQLWTVPEAFAPVAHPQPGRTSGRCDYRVTIEGQSGDAHIIAEFFSRKRPRTGEIAYATVWQAGGTKAVRVGFPNGPRGASPHFTFKAVPVGAAPRAR